MEWRSRSLEPRVGGVGTRVPESSYAWSSAHRANAVSQAGRRSLGFRFPEESVHLGRPRRNPKHWSKTRNGSRVTSASSLTSGPPAQAQCAYWSFPTLFPGFQRGLPGKESSGRLEVADSQQGRGLGEGRGAGFQMSGAGPRWSGWGRGALAEYPRARAGPELGLLRGAGPGGRAGRAGGAGRGGPGWRGGPGRAGVGRCGAGKGSSGAGLQGAKLSAHRWVVNKRGSGGARWRAETARRPGTAGFPAARP